MHPSRLEIGNDPHAEEVRPPPCEGAGRVLIAEDDPPIRRLLSIMLRRTGIPHDVAGDGRSALEMMRERPYDVLLLDLMMPVISGYELIEHLKRDAQRPKTILVMSAVSDADLARLDPDIVTQIIHKPFDVDAVAAVVCDASRACARS